MSAHKICPQCSTEYPPEQRFCATDGATLVSETQDGLIGQVIADRYLIIGTIGEGGMGQVYLAEHVRMQRRCALKVMHREMAGDADAVSRFNREAANASRIQHPNVAAVYDFGEAGDGMLYIAMEFVEGASLSRVVEQHGGLSPRRAANIIRQTADALAVAHHLGIVHRDLKPDNIMLGQHIDGSDLVKLLDFGIAKSMSVAAQKVTRTGLIVGTPDYMSPEQMSGDAVDSRSDIYSLALVAVFVFTAQLPFDRVSSRSALVARLSDPPRSLAQLRPDIAWPAELQRVLARALESDPADRYQKVDEFGRDLTEALNSASGFDMEAVSGARTLAMTPAVREPVTVVTHSSDPLEPPRSRAMSRQAMTVGVAGIVALAGGTFVWKMSPGARDSPPLQETAAPQLPPSTRREDTSGTAAATASPAFVTIVPAARPAPSRTSTIAAVAVSVRRSLRTALDAANQEKYQAAYDALGQADSQIAAEEKFSSGAPTLVTLRQEYRGARDGVKAKCETTLGVNKSMGMPLPTCK